MRKLGLAIAGVVAAGALAVPSTSQAQTNVGTLCDSLLGSGTTDLGIAEIDRCLAASEPAQCLLTDTLDVLGLVRIRHGICLDLGGAIEERTVSVKGVATVRLFP